MTGNAIAPFAGEYRTCFCRAAFCTLQTHRCCPFWRGVNATSSWISVVLGGLIVRRLSGPAVGIRRVAVEAEDHFTAPQDSRAAAWTPPFPVGAVR